MSMRLCGKPRIILEHPWRTNQRTNPQNFRDASLVKPTIATSSEMSEMSLTSGVAKAGGAEAPSAVDFTSRTHALTCVRSQWIDQRKLKARGAQPAEQAQQTCVLWDQAKWRAAFVAVHLGEENRRRFSAAAGRDDMVYYVPTDQDDEENSAGSSVQLEVRRWTVQLPESVLARATEVDWMRSVFVNLAACARYRLTVAVAAHDALHAVSSSDANKKQPAQRVSLTCYASPFARAALGDASFLAGGRETDDSMLPAPGLVGGAGSWISRSWGALTRGAAPSAQLNDSGANGTAFAPCFPNLAFAVEETDGDESAVAMTLDGASDCFCVVLRCNFPAASAETSSSASVETAFVLERPTPPATLFSGFVRRSQLIDALLLKRRMNARNRNGAGDALGIIAKPAAALVRGLAGAFHRGQAPESSTNGSTAVATTSSEPPTATHVRMKGPGGRGGADVSVEARASELDRVADPANKDEPPPSMRCSLLHIRLPWDALMDALLPAADTPVLERVFF